MESMFVGYSGFHSVTLFQSLVLLGIALWMLWKSVVQPRAKRGKSIPGPIGLPLLGYVPFLGSFPYKKLAEMRKKYGDVFGLYLGTRYTVVLNGYNTIKEVLSHPGVQERTEKVFDFLPTGGLHVENGDKWIEQRRFCRNVIRDIGLGKLYWEDLMMEETKRMISKIKATNGKPADINHELMASLVSNILSLLIGRRLQDSKDADKLELSAEFADISFLYLGQLMFSNLIPGLRHFCEKFKIGPFHKGKQTVDDFFKFVRDEINAHKSMTGAKESYDFIDMYLEKIHEMEKLVNAKHSFSERMLHGNVVILFLGASDTIHKSLCWLLRFMVAHEDVQEKVYSELIQVVGIEGRARYEEREKIPYTYATIMEGQRAASIVPLSTSRRANQDIPVKDMIIPKGTEVVANLWGMHNDLQYWDQPELFKPERFLVDNGTKLNKQVLSYGPFSFGRRNCPGTSIAYMEILTYFSEIIKRFKVSVPPGVKPEFKVLDGLVTALEPQPLCFNERN